MERREAYIALNLLPEMGPMRVRALLDCFPDPCAALAAPEAELLRVPRLGPKCAEMIRHWERNCDLPGELRRIAQSGTQVVTLEDRDYPALLKEIHDPPICLYVRGSLDALQRSSCSLAIVGSRMTTSYGIGMAQKLSAAAVRAGWVVVSGLARGVDTAAHTAAVENHGCTIAVLGSGFQYVYPAENVELAQRIIAAEGAVITEFPTLYRPDRKNFPMRNRIISGLCRGTLVVEAGLQSGSLITAAQAMEQERAVFAVPGRADTAYSRGCHALLRDGARLVETFEDVLEEFQLLPSLNDRRQQRAAQEEAEAVVEVQLPPGEYRLWEAIGEGERSIDELVDALDEPASAVLGALLTLEIKQLIRQLPGKRVRRMPRRTARPRGG